MLNAPSLDPVALSLGGLEIRWYSLAYMVGLLYTRRCLQVGLRRSVDWFLLGAVVAMYLWGRVVFELVYDPDYAFAHPLEVMAPRGGGLAFHGSMIGIALATFAAARRWRVPFLKITDEIATAAPLGIALGRIGNYINHELYGRITDLPWGVVFSEAGPKPRHPSQLYESLLEGWLLLVLMRWAALHDLKAGMRTALFLAAYAVARFVSEFFRQPDAAVGFIAFGLSMGQMLSLALLALAGVVAVTAGACKWPYIYRPNS